MIELATLDRIRASMRATSTRLPRRREPRERTGSTPNEGPVRLGRAMASMPSESTPFGENDQWSADHGSGVEHDTSQRAPGKSSGGLSGLVSLSRSHHNSHFHSGMCTVYLIVTWTSYRDSIPLHIPTAFPFLSSPPPLLLFLRPSRLSVDLTTSRYACAGFTSAYLPCPVSCFAQHHLNPASSPLPLPSPPSAPASAHSLSSQPPTKTSPAETVKAKAPTPTLTANTSSTRPGQQAIPP